MAAMNDHHSPPDAAAEAIDDPNAMAYIRSLPQELFIQFNSPDMNPDHLRLLLRRRRPHGATFPDAVTAALSHLEDLFFSEGNAPMVAAYARNTIRSNRARHVAMLRRATSQRLSVDGEIFHLAADITAARNSIEVERAVVRRTRRLLLAAIAGIGDGGERAWSLVERLGRAQEKEAVMVAEMEAMVRDYGRLLLQREAAVAAELTEMAELEEIPQLSPATEEEFGLLCEADRRFREDVKSW